MPVTVGELIDRLKRYHNEDEPIAFLYFTQDDVKSFYEEDDQYGDDFEVTDEEAAQTLHNMMKNCDAEMGMTNNSIGPNAPQSLAQRANAATEPE